MNTDKPVLKSASEWARERWKKCTTHDESRLTELKEYYEELGFEVMIQPFNPEDEPGCTACMKEMPERHRTLFIREKS